MRNLSTQTLEEVFAQHMPTTLVYLLKYTGINNSGNEIVKYFVGPSYVPLTSNGVTYQPAAFKISLANDTADTMPTVSLVFDAGDRQLINELREFDTAPKITLSVVVAERPDVVEIPPIPFDVDSFSIKDTGVRLELKALPVLDEPISGDLITPTIFPFLWDNVAIRPVANGDTPVMGGSNPPTEGQMGVWYPEFTGDPVFWHLV